MIDFRFFIITIVAVFLALGIGILIGVGFGDTVVSETQRDLERSLKGDLDDARERADQDPVRQADRPEARGQDEADEEDEEEAGCGDRPAPEAFKAPG